MTSRVLLIGPETEQMRKLLNDTDRTVSVLGTVSDAADWLWDRGQEVVAIVLDRDLSKNPDTAELIGFCERDWPLIKIIWFEADKNEV